MNESLDKTWLQYLEISHKESGPVKLDQILAERLKAFLKARTVKPYPEDQNEM